MKFIRRIAFGGVLLLGASSHACAQSAEIARLRLSLGGPLPRQNFVPDSAYVNTLDRLAADFYSIDIDSAFYYSRAALDYAGRTNYLKGEAESWRLLGNAYEMVGDFGNMLSSYHQSADIAEKIGNQGLAAKATSNIALFDMQQGEYDKAQQLMQQVMAICRNIGDSALAEIVTSHLSELAFHRHQYDQALQYARGALQSARATHDESDIASNTDDEAKALAGLGQVGKALELYGQSLAYYTKVNDGLGIVTTQTLMAHAYLQLKDFRQALRYAQLSLEGSYNLRRQRLIRESAKALADVYEAAGDDKNALHYFKLYKDFSDSLFNDQSQKRLLAVAAGYDFEKKESRLRAEEAERDARYQQTLRKDAVKISITVLVIVILSLLAFILFRSRYVNRRVNQLLREKNEKIEEQKETVEQQAVQLLLNNRQKDKLFSIIAHDLRGPLNSLKGLMDLLKDGRLSEEEINTIMSEFRLNVDQSAELVSNLLVWASSQLDGIAANPVALPLKPLVQEILALFSHQARQKNILLREEVSPAVGVVADKDMLQVVIRNLVSNAVKFCRSGDSVTVSCTPSGSEIEICVTDTGIGLKEDALDKIRRKESFTSYGTAKEKGTGLGMLLCREFAEANRGSFRIESEWGKGCRCYCCLPAAPAPM
jgi:two-component system, sensor histidine kinase and response regulator